VSYRFDGRYPLPRGLSYPIRRSLFDATLGEHAAGLVGSLGFMKAAPQSGDQEGVVMRADYIGPSEWSVDRTVSGREGAIELRLYAVPSRDRAQVETALTKYALPKLRDWLTWLDSGGTHRDSSHLLRWRWSSEGRLSSEQA
jgi:hypothetical protein